MALKKRSALYCSAEKRQFVNYRVYFYENRWNYITSVKSVVALIKLSFSSNHQALA